MALKRFIPTSQKLMDEQGYTGDEDSMSDEALLGLFRGRKMPDPAVVFEMYSKGINFNTQINLDETVRVNENFFVGKQWEGVPANNDIPDYEQRIAGTERQ